MANFILLFVITQVPKYKTFCRKRDFQLLLFCHVQKTGWAVFPATFHARYTAQYHFHADSYQNQMERYV